MIRTGQFAVHCHGHRIPPLRNQRRRDWAHPGTAHTHNQKLRVTCQFITCAHARAHQDCCSLAGVDLQDLFSLPRVYLCAFVGLWRLVGLVFDGLIRGERNSFAESLHHVWKSQKTRQNGWQECVCTPAARNVRRRWNGPGQGDSMNGTVLIRGREGVACARASEECVWRYIGCANGVQNGARLRIASWMQ